MFFIAINKCSITQFQASTFRHIRYILIAAHTWCSTMKQPANFILLKAFNLWYWGHLWQPLTKGLGPCRMFYPRFFLLHPFRVLHAFCGTIGEFFYISFAGGYFDFVNTSCLFQPCWCIDPSAVVSWACHLLLGHLRDGVPISLLTQRCFLMSGWAAVCLLLLRLVDKSKHTFFLLHLFLKEGKGKS